MGILASEFEKLEKENEKLLAQIEKLRHGLAAHAMYSVFSSSTESVEHAKKILSEVPPPDLTFHDTKERIAGAESFKNELLKSTSLIFHPHFEGVFAVWARQQRKDP